MIREMQRMPWMLWMAGPMMVGILGSLLTLAGPPTEGVVEEEVVGMVGT